MSTAEAKSAPRSTPLFSPRGFLLRAAALLVLFLIAHLAGWREHTSILCGTATSAAGWSRLGGTLGLVYVIVYSIAVVGVPILVLAAGLLALLQRLATKRGAPTVVRG